MNMILRKIYGKGFDVSKLKLNIPKTSIDWAFYYNQYENVLCYLANSQNSLGMRYMSLLFIFRHTIELFLKKRIPSIEITHSIKDLFDKTEELPLDFLEQLALLRCNGDGSDFRYCNNKEGKAYFNKEILQIKAPLEYFFNISNVNVVLADTPKGRYEIHTSYYTMGHISTDYDESMCLIIEGIIQNKLSINDVYLPLIFIIRHSVELSLKQNLIDAGRNYLSEKDITNITKEHSLKKLFHKFESIIDIALNNIPENGNENEQKFKKETEEHQKNWIHYKI